VPIIVFLTFSTSACMVDLLSMVFARAVEAARARPDDWLVVLLKT
jgi:hypothetical protein